MVQKPKARRILRGERDTYNRLWKLVQEGKLYTFYCPKPDRWELFETEAIYVAAGGVGRREADRVYLTKAAVREHFNMDAKPTDAPPESP